MTKEEAIDYLKESVLIYKNTIPKISEAIETVLSMLKEKDREINSRNGTINALQCALKERTEERDRKDELYNKALSDLVKVEHKNIKQNKIIDAMALHIASSAVVDDTVCMYIECNKNTCKTEEAVKCTKQYFEKKVE